MFHVTARFCSVCFRLPKITIGILCEFVIFVGVRAVFTLSVESYCCTLLRYMIGLKKLTPLFQPIRSQTKTNRDSLVQVFPRFALATCIYFKF